jgi:hypothetical protein
MAQGGLEPERRGQADCLGRCPALGQWLTRIEVQDADVFPAAEAALVAQPGGDRVRRARRQVADVVRLAITTADRLGPVDLNFAVGRAGLLELQVVPGQVVPLDDVLTTVHADGHLAAAHLEYQPQREEPRRDLADDEHDQRAQTAGDEAPGDVRMSATRGALVGAGRCRPGTIGVGKTDFQRHPLPA